MEYEFKPFSEMKKGLPKIYLSKTEKMDPTMFRGRKVPDDWVEEWKRHQELNKLGEEKKAQKIKELNEARRIKKISAAKTKYWARVKKEKEKEAKALLTKEGLSKEEYIAAKSLARSNLIDYGIFIGTEKGEQWEPAWFHEEIAEDLMKIANGTNDFDVLMVFVPPGHGKEIEKNVPVLTTEGWKRHGDLVPGDYVFSPNGNPIKVLAKGDDSYEKAKVTFSNGDSVLCHPNHEWEVYDRSVRKYRVVETKYLMRKTKFGNLVKLTSGELGKRGGRYKFQLRNSEAVEFEEKNLELDPYFLGVWLGDGSSTGAEVCGAKEDLDEITKNIPYDVSTSWFHRTTRVKYVLFSHQGIRKSLRNLGIFNNKGIPEIYKFSSKEQRLKLLAGLIDTDGHVEQKRGRVRISTVSRKLADDIHEVATGLGFHPYITETNPVTSSSGIVGKSKVYQVCFNPTVEIPCSLERKKIRRIAKQRRISIASVEPHTDLPGNCIEVDSEDGLYLVGKSLIPTHNSRLGTQLFSSFLLGHNPASQIMVVSYSGELAEKFGSLTRDIMESPKYREMFDTALRRDSRSKDNWETTKGGSYNAVGIGGAVIGKRANVFIIDDLMRGRAEADSKTYRDAAWDFFTGTALTRGANRLTGKKPVYIFFNTRWHLDDVPGRLIEMSRQNEGGLKVKVISYSAISEADDGIRKEGEALWEKAYPASELMKIKSTISGYEWSAQYQQNPITAENQEFKPDNIQYIELDDVLRRDAAVYMTIDTAISQKTSGDYTGVTINFVEKDGMWNVMTFQRRFTPKQLIDFMFEKRAQYGIKTIGIEKTIYQMAIREFMNDEMRTRGQFLSIVELQHSNTNKETRIRGLVPYYESKTIRHIKGRVEGLEEELFSFPASRHDDVIDSLAYQTQLVVRPIEQRPMMKRPKLQKYR